LCRSDYGLAVGVQFDFPSSPARVALAEAHVELSAVGTHVLGSAAVVQADEIVLKQTNELSFKTRHKLTNPLEIEKFELERMKYLKLFASCVG
jgi:hypothetical protein